MSKIVLKGHIIIPSNDLEKVKYALREHIALTQNEPGCLIFEVNQDQNEKNRFNVYEVFTDQSAFELHQQRVKNSHWGKVTSNAKRFYDIYEID